METKVCSKCKIEKLLCEFNKSNTIKQGVRAECRKCQHLEYQKTKQKYRNRKKQYYQKHKNETKNSDLLLNYGITITEYNKLWKNQNGLCAICKQPEVEQQKECSKRRLSVDHNHATKEIRGLLCGKCNKAVGLFQENIEFLKSAILYLNIYNGNK